jgi:hypothetical protein
MSKQCCEFCKTVSASVKPACNCGFGALLYCASRAVCAGCEKSHRQTFGPFFKALLGTAPATRSNSPRTRLLVILNETAGFYRREFAGGESVCDLLRRTNSFDVDGANFRARILDAAARLPLTAEVAATICAKVKKAVLIRAVERLDESMKETYGEKYSSEDLLSDIGKTAARCAR